MFDPIKEKALLVNPDGSLFDVVSSGTITRTSLPLTMLEYDDVSEIPGLLLEAGFTDTDYSQALSHLPSALEIYQQAVGVAVSVFSQASVEADGKTWVLTTEFIREVATAYLIISGDLGRADTSELSVPDRSLESPGVQWFLVTIPRKDEVAHLMDAYSAAVKQLQAAVEAAEAVYQASV